MDELLEILTGPSPVKSQCRPLDTGWAVIMLLFLRRITH